VTKHARLSPLIAILVVLALVTPAFADTLVKNISLRQPAKLGAMELKPGDYRLEFDGAKVTLKKGAKVVAEAKGQWVDTKEKAPGDTFVVENGAISEVRVEGQSRVIKIQ